MKIKLAIVFFFIFFFGKAQTKFEKEYNIKPSQVPQKAIAFIKQCKFDKGVRWYAEESQDGKTIEAKSCKNKHRFSVEFDQNGNVLDVEKTIKWQEIDLKTQQLISKGIQKRFGKYKLKKIQIHWETDHDFYIDLINGNGEDQIAEFYEIVLKTKVDKVHTQFEILIDAQGTILKELKFAPANLDNLEF